MNSFFKETKGVKPKFLYLGSEEYALFKLSEGLFCPGDYKKQITESSAFGMEIVTVMRDSFMEVGC